jgi:hypothetical protein
VEEWLCTLLKWTERSPPLWFSTVRSSETIDLIRCMAEYVQKILLLVEILGVVSFFGVIKDIRKNICMKFL